MNSTGIILNTLKLIEMLERMILYVLIYLSKVFRYKNPPIPCGDTPNHCVVLLCTQFPRKVMFTIEDGLSFQRV